MTDIFTATYGTRIRSRGFPHPIEVDDSTFGWQPIEHYVGGSMMDNAMAEWYQHRRDVELGRWRDPENPNMVVYRVPESEDKGGRAVHVIDEATGVHVSLWERDVKRFERGGMHATAARYFEQHPEPEPEWHDAKPGEAWVLTIDGTEHLAQTITGRIAIYPHDADPEFFIPTLIPTNTIGDIWEHTWSPSDHRITAGRRIWPTEESDDE